MLARMAHIQNDSTEPLEENERWGVDLANQLSLRSSKCCMLTVCLFVFLSAPQLENLERAEVIRLF